MMVNRKPEPVPLLPLDEAALALARKFRLISDDGQVLCIRGCKRPATLPSLCCRECLAAHRRGWR